MIINQKTKALQAKVGDSIKDLHNLVQEIGHKELSETVGELRNRMDEPFMFVIVGEVKAGKSSFINALLDTGQEICKVAPQPMTDTVQQILYGEQEAVIVINDFLQKRFLPIDILRELAIVDTPGTNSIVQQHQVVTERFVPASDLVIFVFEAKNPYRQSAWDFFDFIHKDWHKKIIFVLQQKDLMEPADLEVNQKGLYEFAEKKGVMEPIIYSVSAKNELEGKYDESGFSSMRDYIRTHVTGGRGAALKLSNNLATADTILERIRRDLDARSEQYRVDVAFRADVRDTLSSQSKKSTHHVELLVENLLNGYDRITINIGEELSSGLSFMNMMKRSVMGIFSKQTSIKEWLEGLAEKLELQLNSEIRVRLNEGVVDLADSVQQMAKMIDLKIKNSSTLVKSDDYIFEDISEKRSSVLKELQEAFGKFLSRSENFRDEKLFPENTGVSPNIAAGGGIAIVGILLAAVTQTAVFDITGGILTGVGLLFAGITAGLQKRKIVEGYYTEIKKGRAQMEETLENKLGGYIDTIKTRIDGNFSELDAMLSNEEVSIGGLDDTYDNLKSRIERYKSELEL